MDIWQNVWAWTANKQQCVCSSTTTPHQCALEQGCLSHPSVLLLLLFLYFSSLLLPSMQSSALPVAHQYINHPDSPFISLSEAEQRTLNI